MVGVREILCIFFFVFCLVKLSYCLFCKCIRRSVGAEQVSERINK